MKQLRLFPEVSNSERRCICLQRAGSLGIEPKTTIDKEIDGSPKEGTQGMSAFCFDKSSFGDVSIDSSASNSSTCTSYYDIPLPENPSEVERRICLYLDVHDIHVSHPEMKQKRCFISKSSSPSSNFQKRKSDLLERRMSLYIKSGPLNNK